MGSITVSSLSKAYKQYPSRWSRLREWITPGERQYHQTNWVLQDINFAVKPGEALGIIGINGAGKSTLLKLITGTTQPTKGSVQLSGRVAAMLELGLGFHPDFTGRQNAFLAGQLLGLTSEDISMAMAEILAFAEIGDYIDKPVRVYSSGMQIRLAFSVATAIRPDILIVDEALSVGDAYFQHKSFERIRKYRKLGTTLLIVSHDKQAIQSICDRAILLSAGRLLMEGAPEAVMDYYNAALSKDGTLNVRQFTMADRKVQTISGTGGVSLDGVELLNAKNEQVEVINIGERVHIKVRYTTTESVSRLTIGFMVKDRLGQTMFGTNTDHLDYKIKDIPANYTAGCIFSFFANFGVGSYSVTLALHAGKDHITENYEWRDLATVFSVINLDKPEAVGVCWLPVDVTGDTP